MIAHLPFIPTHFKLPAVRSPNTVLDKNMKMTITNIILTNQWRPYNLTNKSKLQKLQLKIHKIDMS